MGPLIHVYRRQKNVFVILHESYFFFLDPDQISSIVASRMVTCPPIVSAMETRPSLRREGRASQVDTLDVSNDVLFRQVTRAKPKSGAVVKHQRVFVVL